MPVELNFDGVIWGLANGEVRIPLRGDHAAIVEFMDRVREMAGATDGPQNMRSLGFAAEPGLLVVSGVATDTRAAVEAILRAVAASTP